MGTEAAMKYLIRDSPDHRRVANGAELATGE
jgi:hypothetical protein